MYWKYRNLLASNNDDFQFTNTDGTVVIFEMILTLFYKMFCKIIVGNFSHSMLSAAEWSLYYSRNIYKQICLSENEFYLLVLSAESSNRFISYWFWYNSRIREKIRDSKGLQNLIHVFFKADYFGIWNMKFVYHFTYDNW